MKVVVRSRIVLGARAHVARLEAHERRKLSEGRP